MLVFVYGTLKRGFPNHGLIVQADGEFKGTLATQPEYTMFNMGSYPGVVPRGGTCINGEVYEVEREALKELDRLEGYPNLYTREQIVTRWGMAWIYLLSPTYLYDYGVEYASEDIIKGGTWNELN